MPRSKKLTGTTMRAAHEAVIGLYNKSCGHMSAVAILQPTANSTRELRNVVTSYSLLNRSFGHTIRILKQRLELREKYYGFRNNLSLSQVILILAQRRAGEATILDDKNILENIEDQAELIEACVPVILSLVNAKSQITLNLEVFAALNLYRLVKNKKIDVAKKLLQKFASGALDSEDVYQFSKAALGKNHNVCESYFFKPDQLKIIVSLLEKLSSESKDHAMSLLPLEAKLSPARTKRDKSFEVSYKADYVKIHEIIGRLCSYFDKHLKPSD